jgi:hypothetical protein
VTLPSRRLRPSRAARLVLLAVVAALSAGCATGRDVTRTARSGVEQEILVRSLERAVAGLDLRSVQDRRVALDIYGLTKDVDFAREYLVAAMEARGVRVVPASEHPDRRLKVFTTILGTDRDETFFGIPAFPVPVLTVPFPEVPLFKWVRNRGLVEMQTFAYDARTGEFLGRLPTLIGRSKFDQFAILLLIGFTVSDLDEPPPSTAPPAAR